MQTIPTVERDIPLNLYKNVDPLLVTVERSIRLTPPGTPEVRHVVLRFPKDSFHFLEGQAVGIPPPGLNERGRPNVPRLYSIASDRDGDDGVGTSLTLTVKRVMYVDEHGNDRFGMASNYLCEAAEGQVLRMTGPAGKEMVPPDDPSYNLIMISTGTGIAPFRGYVQRLRRLAASQRGRVLLYAGAKTAVELPYYDEWQALATEPWFTPIYALSREQSTADGHHMHVQDRLREGGSDLWNLVTQPNTLIFLCGMKGMETGVNEAFQDLAAQHGSDWSTQRAQLVAEKRWRVEVY